MSVSLVNERTFEKRRKGDDYNYKITLLSAKLYITAKTKNLFFFLADTIFEILIYSTPKAAAAAVAAAVCVSAPSNCLLF